jgi:hypothetical protein
MQTRLRYLLLALACLAGPAGSAAAQETGSISGYIFDASGTAVPGATITVTGELLPGARTVTTGDSGFFQVPVLLPGTYTVKASKAGVGDSQRTVVVEVSRDSQVDLALGVALQESVAVTAATPRVDLRSTEVNFNFSKDLIDQLPLQRTYAGLFQLVPGVAENNSFAPNGGGSRQDNTYLLDGVNITNPGFGYLSTEVNEFDIQEFSVKRGAITAEFGRASGFVTNAVTRSGSNRLSGGVRLETIPSAWITSSDKTIRSTTDRLVPSVAVGGPVLRDRIFFYGSAQATRADTTDRSNNLGAVPDREQRTYDYFGKITAAPAAQHFLSASYRSRPNTDEFAGVGANDSAAVATNTEGTNRVATATYSWFFSSTGYVDVKYLRLDEQNETVAVTDLGFQPAFDIRNLPAMGLFTANGVNVGGASLSLNRQNYSRDEVKAVVSQYVDLKGMSHQIKAGFGVEGTTEDLTRQSNGWGSISIVQAGRQIQARYYPRQPSQLSKSRTYSLFFQDNISIGQRLVVNAGILFNEDSFAQELASTNTFLTFGFGSQIQPRLGFNYQLRQGQGDKVYANYGRYYNSDQKSSARSLAPNRLFTNDALFDATTGALISDTPGANTTGKVLRDLDPTYTDEVLFGYATPVFGTWTVDAFFLYRTSKDFIEDQPTVLPASTFVVDNLDNAYRKYRAFTVELSRPLRDKWSLTASYAHTRLWGNFDLDYAASAVFNTSSILQDGPGVFVEDRLREGPLSQDRTHVLKLFASWVPTSQFTVGGYLRAQSGQPWEARGRDWYDGYRRYLEPAGTNRNDFWTNLDVLAAYKLRLGARSNLTFEARVLNLFNQETALERDNRLYLDGRIRTLDGSQIPGDLSSYTDAMIQGTTQPNPRFGEPTVYASPRRLLGTIRLDF